jgi:Skp family chaperone for outer membrane proteins
MVEVAAKLRISHEAARKRLHRALERLRALLSRERVVMEADALSVALAALAKPALMAPKDAIASTALAGGTHGSAFTLAHATMHSLTWLAVRHAAAIVGVVALMSGAVAVAVAQITAASPPSSRATTRAVSSATQRAPAAGPTIIDYPKVFSDAQEAKDKRADLERLRVDLMEAGTQRAMKIGALRHQRDGTPKDAPQYAEVANELAKAIADDKAQQAADRLKTQRESVRAMAVLFQRIELAVTAVGKEHGLDLAPANTPAYPAHYDATDMNRLRAILNRRVLARPAKAPDLTEEVIKYLDSHPNLAVPGLPDPPAGTPEPTLPPEPSILMRGVTQTRPTSQP